MSTDLSKLVTAIQKVDPGVVQRLYPSREQFDEYVRLKQAAIKLLEQVRPRGLPNDLYRQLVDLAEQLQKLSDQISPNTELGGRLLVNKIVIWAEAHHLERAIYLAGQCHGTKIKEPFRTQIRLQPANACMSRYRQVLGILEWIEMNIHAAPDGDIANTFASMLKALLEQFEYFASEAHRGNPRHVFAAYMLALAHLFRAQEQIALGNNDVADNLGLMARQLVDDISEPNMQTRKVELQYHQKNHQEFIKFPGLCKRHPAVAARLAFLGDKADRLLKADGGEEKPTLLLVFVLCRWGRTSCFRRRPDLGHRRRSGDRF